METLASWRTGWTIVADADDTYLAIAHGEEPSDNISWEMSDIENDTDRAAQFTDLLDRLLGATLVDTDHLSGIVVDITGYDEDRIGDIRGIFTLKDEDSDTVYVENGTDLDSVLKIMREYEGEEQGS